MARGATNSCAACRAFTPTFAAVARSSTTCANRAASATGARGGTSQPVRPSRTQVGCEPTAVAITGAPTASASGSGSGELADRLGPTTTAALEYTEGSCSRLTGLVTTRVYNPAAAAR